MKCGHGPPRPLARRGLGPRTLAPLHCPQHTPHSTLSTPKAHRHVSRVGQRQALGPHETRAAAPRESEDATKLLPDAREKFSGHNPQTTHPTPDRPRSPSRAPIYSKNTTHKLSGSLAVSSSASLRPPRTVLTTTNTLESKPYCTDSQGRGPARPHLRSSAQASAPRQKHVGIHDVPVRPRPPRLSERFLGQRGSAGCLLGGPAPRRPAARRGGS